MVLKGSSHTSIKSYPWISYERQVFIIPRLILFLERRIMKNTQKRNVNVCIILVLVFLFTGILCASMFGSWGGFAGMGILLSIAGGITSFACIFIFKKRSDSFEEALKNKSSLGHFIYSQKEWAEYTKQDTLMRNQEKMFIFIVLSAITIPIFLIFIVFVDEAQFAMFFMMCGLIGLYAIMAFIVPKIICVLRNTKGAEIMILDKAIILDGEFHTWDFPLSKISSIREKKKPFPHMQVSYDFVDRLGPRSYVFRVPFPQKDEGFRKAFAALKRKNGLV